MRNRNKKRDRIIVPPQFLDSPSEQKGYLGGSSTLYLFFACGIILVLALAFVLFVVVPQILPRLTLP